MNFVSKDKNSPLKPKLLPTPFDNIKCNENVTSSSFAIPNIYKREVTAFPPWYDPAKNLDYKSSKIKIEDPTTVYSKWNFPTSDKFQFFQSPKARNFNFNKDFYCDTCDRSLPDATSLQVHQAEHMTCNIQGCKFRAHPKIVSLHKKMQHQTGLAKKIMSLDTPEDIQKWREERKRNFPTAENRERKKQEEEEKKSRGEVLTNKYFGKMRSRGGWSKNRNRNCALLQHEANSNQQQKNHFRGRGRGQRGRAGFKRNNRNYVNSRNPSTPIALYKKNTLSNAFKQPNNLEEADKPVLKPFAGILKNYNEENGSESESLNEIQIKKAKISDCTNQNFAIEEVNAPSDYVQQQSYIDEEEKNKCKIDFEENITDKLVTIVNSIEIDNDIKEIIISEIEQKNNAVNGSSIQRELEEGEITPDEEEEMEHFSKPATIEISSNKQGIEKTKTDDVKSKHFFVATDSDDEKPEEKLLKCSEQNEKSVDIKESPQIMSGALSSLMANYGSDSDSDDEPDEVSSKIEPQKYVTESRKEVKKIPVPNLHPISKRQTTLLEKLLSNEIRHERNVVLQCVHYIVKNDFLDNIK